MHGHGGVDGSRAAGKRCGGKALGAHTQPRDDSPANGRSTGTGIKKELYTIIADHSHTDFDKVWADSDRDYWMTADEAKEYGMIDNVLKRK